MPRHFLLECGQRARAAVVGRCGPTGAAAIAISLVWLVGVSRWYFYDGVVPWDSKNQFFAFFRFLAESLHAGTSVFWNPYHYGGHPSIADPQSLIFSPPFLLWAWFDRAPTLRSFDLIVQAHLLVGGLAMAGLGRRRGWSGPATVLGATMFMLGGSASARLNHTGIILSYGMFPLALLLLETALERRSWPHILAFSAVAASIILGRNQVALMLCLVLAVLAARQVAVAARPFEYLKERLPLLAASGAMVFAITIVPLLLTLQLAALSNRPASSLTEALASSLHPANLVSLFAPNVFGSHVPGFNYWGPQYSLLPEVGATDDSFNYLFIGSAPTLLLLWLGIAGGRFGAKGYRTMAAILAVAWLFVLGRYAPLFPFVFENIPGFSFFRRPIDGTFIVLLAMAMLCGQLADDYVRRGLPALSPAALAVLLSAGLAVLIAAVQLASQTGHGIEATMAIAGAGLMAGALALAIASANGAERRRMATLAIVAATSAELLYWNAASRLNSEDRRHYELLETASSEDAEALNILRRELARRHFEGARPRIEVVGLHGPWQNLAMVYQLEATNGYNPLRIGIYDRFIAPGESSWVAISRRFPATFNGYDCELARALGLEYLVLGRPIEELGREPRRRRYDVLLAGPKVWIYRLHGSMPRVAFSSRIEVADVEATTGSGELSHPPSADRVVIDDETVPSSGIVWMRAAGEGSKVHITSWRPGLVEIEAEAAQAGVLVLHDTYYPGWTAELDGKRVPILRAEVLFRAVEVPAGRHRIVFRFDPLSIGNLADAVAMLARRGQRRQREDE